MLILETKRLRVHVSSPLGEGSLGCLLGLDVDWSGPTKGVALHLGLFSLEFYIDRDNFYLNERGT